MVRPVDAKHPVTLGYRQKAKFDPDYVHRGVDYGCPTGTPVVATRGGEVVHARAGGGYGSAYGIHVVIRVGNVWCVYAHLSAEQVAVGQTVKTGQRIGSSGATGNARGAHLHYQECTEPPAEYRSDRMPQFISYVDGPVDRMDPANYYVGASGDHVLWLGQRLEAHGFGDNYTPTKNFTKADVKAVAAFQRAQGWSGKGADGLPGRESLKRLAAAPKPKPKLPAQLIDLRNAKLTTPFGKEDHPTEVTQPGLAKFADARCFFVRGDDVIFRVTGAGVTTENSDNPRCETREMVNAGKDRASWDTRDGKHVVEAEYMVKTNAKVVIAQFHDAKDDLVMVSVEGSRVVAEFSKGKGKGSEKIHIIGTVPQGQGFKVGLGAEDGAVWVTLNGQIKVKRTRARSGCYGKAGAYLQSDDPRHWAEVAVRKNSFRMGRAA